MTVAPPDQARAQRELVVRAAGATSARDLLRVTSEGLRQLVPFDASVWLACDPATNLPTGPGRFERMGHINDVRMCQRVWELEFFVEDVNLYRDLARAQTPAGGLRMATRDRPSRSARYRDYMTSGGFGDELRAVMRVDGRSWAMLCLFREQGRPPFDAGETRFVGSTATSVAPLVREHARPLPRPPDDGEERGPGLLLFAPNGELISINDEALAWLDELPSEHDDVGPFGVRLPTVVAGTHMRARAIAAQRDDGTARARLRSRASGRWLVCHASCMRATDGSMGNTALVIEPATPTEIAPIISQAYELSPREQQITQRIARGLSTAEIAADLVLSPHTVRDYVKAVFEKVGVRSRGELVAKLFADHYRPGSSFEDRDRVDDY